MIFCVPLNTRRKRQIIPVVCQAFFRCVIFLPLRGRGISSAAASGGRLQDDAKSAKAILGGFWGWAGGNQSVCVGLGKAAVCAGLKCYGGKIFRNDVIGDSHRPGHRGRDFRADEQLLSLSLIGCCSARDSRSSFLCPGRLKAAMLPRFGAFEAVNFR